MYLPFSYFWPPFVTTRVRGPVWVPKRPSFLSRAVSALCFECQKQVFTQGTGRATFLAYLGERDIRPERLLSEMLITLCPVVCQDITHPAGQPLLPNSLPAPGSPRLWEALGCSSPKLLPWLGSNWVTRGVWKGQSWGTSGSQVPRGREKVQDGLPELDGWENAPASSWSELLVVLQLPESVFSQDSEGRSRPVQILCDASCKREAVKNIGVIMSPEVPCGQ